ncbi:DNA gyrase subunit A [Natronocella acetinitrilica]|uniref:DNA topoisomerase (ATP-hydrolyzing) n=1 Tax=Natronocella acetinitrilica TaxID=414046 RepID=A0AAE3G1V9_9GAMM|nr:DNA gyrase subunit A [Natronocella acetinitrilica]MCP1674290.1 DNA gyrase subunit A [Natronocella acetinitrilica]
MSENTLAEIIHLPVKSLMESSYLDYAMSVITHRALPDARDGLKPVHRRILYAMHDMGITPGGAHKKSARVVGEVLGKYHPHGDSAAYETAVRMAQPWALGIPLIDGQGNFGSVDGDSPAAMRYTEMRLSRAGARLFADIQKSTVDFRDNFDGSEREPSVLPVSFPLLWTNGVEGIAVGMACSIPPHNLAETASAFLAWMDNREISTAELIGQMPAPDFPTGGTVHGLDGYVRALETGRGVVKLRACWSVEERKSGQRVAITEIPYQVKKAVLVERIADLVRERKVEGIVDLRDESNKDGMRVVLDIKRGYEPELIMMHLLALTNLEVSVSYNVMALVQGQPEQLGIRRVFEVFRDHRIEVIRRRTQHDLDRLLARLHVLEGLIRALDRLDETITTIRESADAEEASTGLRTLLGITEVQAAAILEMRLQRLTGLQIVDIRNEHERVTLDVADLREILASDVRQAEILVEELNEAVSAHSIARRTEISHELSRVTSEDLVKKEEVILFATLEGYVKRLPVTSFNRQNRGTKGRSVMDVGEDDVVTAIHSASTHDYLLAITEVGQVYTVKAHAIPESPPGAKGRHYRNVFNGLEQGHVVAMLSAPDIEDESLHLVVVMESGYIKRVPLTEFRNAGRQGGVRGVTLDEGDSIIAARISSSEEDRIVIVGDHGKAIYFPVCDVRPMGRSARGVRGIKLPVSGQPAKVIAAEVIAAKSSAELVCVGLNGVGKRTAVDAYPLQGRGGQGTRCFAAIKRSGPLSAATILAEGEDALVFNTKGGANRIKGSDIPLAGRSTTGAQMIRNGEVRGVIAVPAAEEVADDGCEGQGG